MGNVRTLLDNPTFRKMDERTQRFVLDQAGVPGAAGDPLDAVLARAEALARAQEAGGSVMTTKAAGPAGPSLGTRVLTGLGATAKEALPSVLGGIAGAVGGPFIPGIGALPSQAHQALGSMAGEAAAQAAGLNPSSLEQILMAGAAPMGARQAARVLPSATMTVPKEHVGRFVGILPGAGGALAEQAAEEIRARPGILRQATGAILGDETVESLFLAAREANPTIGLDRTAQVLSALKAEEGKATQGGVAFGRQYRGILTAMGATIAKNPEGMPLEHIDIWRQRIGAMIGKTSDLNAEQKGFLKQIYAGLMQDFEQAAQQGEPGAEALLTGVKAARREFAADDLERMIEHTGFGLPRPDGIPDPRTGAMLREFRQMARDDPSHSLRLFKDSITKDEFTDIKDVLEFWHERKVALAPPRGVASGSAQNVLAGAVGYATAGPEGAGALITARWALTRLLMSKQGRTALRELIARDQPIGLTELAAVAGTQLMRSSLGVNPLETSRRLYEGMRAPGARRLEVPPPTP